MEFFMTMIEGTIWSLPDEEFRRLKQRIDRRYVRRINATGIRIANLYRQGKTTAEIAPLVGLAPRTVRRYKPQK